MLLRVDPAGQAGPVIACIDRYRRLDQHRPGVDLEADQVGGAAADAHPSCQGLLDCTRTAEARQERGVNVDQPIRKRIDQLLGDDPHPPRHHNQLHGGCLKAGDQGPVEGLAAGVLAVVVQLPGDAEPLCPDDGAAVGVVHHQQRHIRRQRSGAPGSDQGFKVAAVAGGKHPEPKAPAAAGWSWRRLR